MKLFCASFILFCSCGPSQYDFNNKWRDSELIKLEKQRDNGHISNADYEILKKQTLHYKEGADDNYQKSNERSSNASNQKLENFIRAAIILEYE